MATVIRGGFEWDAEKATLNLSKHGVDFAVIDAVDWSANVTISQRRGGEERFLTYALADDRLYAIVWTERDGRVRVISVRKANPREVDRFEQDTTPGP